MTIVAKLAGPFPEILEHNFNDAPDFTKVQVIIVNKKMLEIEGGEYKAFFGQDSGNVV